MLSRTLAAGPDADAVALQVRQKSPISPIKEPYFARVQGNYVAHIRALRHEGEESEVES